jgi:hypothetical protein
MPGFRSLSQSEIDAIIPVAGTMVYNTTTNKLNVYNGTNWYELPYGDCVPDPTIANAGIDQTQINDSVFTLAANNPQYGTGKWTIFSGTGGSFSDDKDPNAVFTGRRSLTYTLRWTITNGCSSNSDDVNIQVLCSPMPASEAGPDKSSSNGTFAVTMGATSPTDGTGTWSVVTGSGGIFSNVHDPAATFTGTPIQGTSTVNYSLAWTVSNVCSSVSDNAGVSVSCGPSQIYCAPSCTNTQIDVNNCGSCGHACGSAPHATLNCNGGTCQIASCDPGWKDCDGIVGNGCEANTTSPPYCNGSCTICAPGSKCCNGSCVVTKSTGDACVYNCECPTGCVGGICH